MCTSRSDTIPESWNAFEAIRRQQVEKFSGRTWRVHQQRYGAMDPAGSLLVSGRYHKGADHFADEEVFPALYTSLSPEICLAELVRHTSAETLPHLNNFRLSELAVDVSFIVDCTVPDALGLSYEDLCGDETFRYTQAIGTAANSLGYEAVRVPSATDLGNNLIIFPENLRSISTIAVISSRDPRLRVDP